MKTKLLSKRNFITLVVAILALNTLSARDWFVKAGASTSSAGDSWEAACNISVISGANPSGIADGDVVYLAAGDYTRSTGLTISKYITVYGGYSASSTGTDVSTRNYVNNKAIFAPVSSPTAGFNTRCITINATAAPTISGQKIILDGLYFNAFTSASTTSGATISVTTAQSGIDFKNLSFTNNVATVANGAAIYFSSFAYIITITIDGCTFTGNQATGNSNSTGYGGAIFINNTTATAATAKTFDIKNCSFVNNSAYTRAGAIYFSALNTVSVTDCTFDSNQCTIATDNVSLGVCFYASDNNTFTFTKSIFLNSLATAKGSVFYGNSTNNKANFTNCSLIGNYASRASGGRAAIDDGNNFTTNLTPTLTNCVLSNYNNVTAAKVSNKADLMNFTGVNASTSCTIVNSIVNGTYLANTNCNLIGTTGNPSYATTGYLNDATIALALSGDLKITDKIVFKKTFIAAEVGTYTHAQIFDVKVKMGFPMTLVATIPTGYKLTVNGTDHSAGTDVQISIPVAATDPVIVLAVDGTTGNNVKVGSEIKFASANGMLTVSGINAGEVVNVYNVSGQLINKEIAKSSTVQIPAKGFVIVKINSFVSKILVK
jgi:hypothetical protein